MPARTETYATIQARIHGRGGRRAAAVRLLAVSKTQPAAAVRALAARASAHFGENYVQEALAKQRELADLALSGT